MYSENDSGGTAVNSVHAGDVGRFIRYRRSRVCIVHFCDSPDNGWQSGAILTFLNYVRRGTISDRSTVKEGSKEFLRKTGENRTRHCDCVEIHLYGRTPSTMIDRFVSSRN